jgi:signal transduction histidine kinase
VHLTVKDNGHGFQGNGASGSGLGLVGMRARAQSVGGALEIKSEGGVSVDLWAPLDNKNDANPAS